MATISAENWDANAKEEMVKIAQIVIAYANARKNKMEHNSTAKIGESFEETGEFPPFHISELVKTDGASNQTPMTEQQKKALLRIHTILWEFFPLLFKVDDEGMVFVRNGKPKFPTELIEQFFTNKWKTMISRKEWEESDAYAVLTFTRMHFQELKKKQPKKDEWVKKHEKDIHWYKENNANEMKQFMTSLGMPKYDKEEVFKSLAAKQSAVFE